MNYYLRLTESDKFVTGGVYSEEFLNYVLGDCCPTTDNWKVLRSDVAILLDGTNEQFIQARNLLIEICGEDYEFEKPLPNYNYLTIGSMGGILLMNRVDGYDIVTLPINKIKSIGSAIADDIIDGYSTSCNTPINWDGVKDMKEWDYKLTQKILSACESLNLSYLDGKILESLTNKDYTKIIELCKTQLNN